MATKKIIYYCDKCGTECDSEQEALECESQHLMPRQVKPTHYKLLEKYPDIIQVRFNDGTTHIYALKSKN